MVRKSCELREAEGPKVKLRGHRHNIGAPPGLRSRVCAQAV